MKEKTYLISAVATKYDIHPQTLRLYEREGLLIPSRSSGNTRIYSEKDLEKLEFILNLSRDMGVNLAGIEIIFNMKKKMSIMQDEFSKFIEELKKEFSGKEVLLEEKKNAIVKLSSTNLTLFNNEKKVTNSTDSLGLYFQKIKNVPILSTEEERKLIEEAQKGNEKSFSKLIIANQRLVIREALRYYFKKDNLLDLINEGNKGLIEALKRFDLSRDNKFFTYALWWVKSEIRQYLSKNQNLIALPDIFYNDYLKFKKTKYKLTKKLEKKPTIKELAEELGVPEKKIKVLLSVPDEILSLDKGIKDGNSPKLSNFIQDKNADDPELLMQALALKNLIKSDIEELNEKEEMVIKLRFGFGGNDPLKLRQIAKIMKMSPEGIRRIESKALKKLRQTLKKKGIYGVLN